MGNIHPSAVVDPSAKIDPSVKIGPGAYIGENVEIGAGTTVGPHAVVENVVMGKDNRLHPGCFVGTPPQDLKFKGEPSRLVMGDGNTVRECVTLNRGTEATGETRIGSGCLFMAYAHVAHDCRIGSRAILVNAATLAGHVEVGDGAILSGLVAVHQFVHIGKLAMISGGSMVGKDVPPFCVAQGDRAALRGINVLGLRRAGAKADVLRAVREAYKDLFAPGVNLDDALAAIRKGTDVAEVLHMIEFIEGAQKRRGITIPAQGAVAEEAAF